MAFDGLFTHAMVHELNETLSNGRVNKISQPYPNEIILTIRSNRKNYPLLLSANPRYARFQITEIPYSNPATPTNFTMMLRKYLDGAKLLHIRQLDNDRIAYFEFVTRNELGDSLPLLLSIEIMGRYSNVILINQNTNKIIDTIKHIGMDQNRFRTLLPGATYRQPPQQDKENPFMQTTNIYLELVKQYPNREVLATQLMQHYQGLAKDSALLLADRLHQNDDYQANFINFFETANKPTPTLLKDGNFSIFPTEEKSQTFITLSSLLDAYYQFKATRDRVQQQGGQLLHLVKKQLQKNKIKLKKLSTELKATQKADNYRIKGEILNTYLHQVKRGMTQVNLPNFYDNNQEITIQLSNQLSPSKNAQKYFKKYQKLKNAVAFISKQISLAKEEIDYLEEVQTQIELATPSDLDDIKLELQQEGYLKKQVQKNKRKVNKVSKPETFIASDGTEIIVGKNNLQNEKLTLHTAKKTDIWLHAKNIPGSHVIIKSDSPSDEVIFEAAMLAAYFSKFRNSANVPVDYVAVKNIRKPSGSKPGFVIYEGQKTILVTPSEDFVAKLRQCK